MSSAKWRPFWLGLNVLITGVYVGLRRYVYTLFVPGLCMIYWRLIYDASEIMKYKYRSTALMKNVQGEDQV